MRDRIMTLAEARSGYEQMGRRPTEVPRLPPRPRDPAWCGQRLMLSVRGVQVEFYLAGSMAAALGVTRDSLLRLEASGVVPPATYFAPGPWPGRGRARVYPCDQVIHAAMWIDAAGLRHRRLSYHRDRVRHELQRISDQAHAGIAAPLPTAGSRPA